MTKDYSLKSQDILELMFGKCSVLVTSCQYLIDKLYFKLSLNKILYVICFDKMMIEVKRYQLPT